MDQNNIPANHSNTPDDEIDLRELIITLLRGWKIILASTLIVTVLAAIYAYRLPDQYVVTTKAATVGSSNGKSSDMVGLAALAGVNIGSGEKEVDLLEHIDVLIKNSHFMDALLAKKWVIPKSKNDALKSSIKYDTLTLAEYWKVSAPDTTLYDWEYRHKMRLYGRLRNQKYGYLSVENAKGVLSLKTRFDNAELAFQVHEELLMLLKEYFRNDYSSRDREKRIFVEERLAEIEAELKVAEKKLLTFREKNRITMDPLAVNGAPRVVLKMERLMREVELQASLYKELIKQLELAKIEEKKETPVFEILQSGELPIFPSEPNRRIILFVALLLGLVIGGAGVLLKDWLITLKGDL